MRATIVIVPKEDKTEYTKAIVLPPEEKSASRFGSQEEGKPSVVYLHNGTDVPEVNLTLVGLEELKSIKIDGEVIKLDPVNRRQLSKVSRLLDDIQEDGTDEFKGNFDDILADEGFDAFVKDLVERLGIVNGGGSSDLGASLKVYDGKKHMLITGGAGEGKTYLVDKYGKDSKKKVFFKALDNGTEAIDLLGHLIKLPDGQFAWKDGVVTQAFRAAARGESTLLFLDELLRAPEKELSILVGCLTPNSDGKLVLRTGRPLVDTLDDGVVEEEVLETTIDKLWCVATTNQGKNYHTGKIDMALKDRFRIFHQKMSTEDGKLIAKQVLSETPYGTKLSEAVMDSIVNKVYNISDAIATHVDGDGKLKQYMTIRHITEAFNTSDNTKEIKKRLLDTANNLVMIDSSGNLNVEQLSIIRDHIKVHAKF